MSSEVTIDEVTDSGVWVRRNNRLRFVMCSPEELTSLKLDSLDKTRRAFAEGTHEPVTYYRDAEGKVCIPPTADTDTGGFERLQINTLADADRICREVQQDYYERFSNETFTEDMDKNLGDPRGVLNSRLSVSRSNLERDTIRGLLKELDKEEDKRRSVYTEAHFRWRES
jgi:hypothetical protein